MMDKHMKFFRVHTLEEASEVLLEALTYESSVIPAAVPVNTAISGGRSISPFMEALRLLPAQSLKRFQLYLVDERIEKPHNIDELMDAGFRKLISEGNMREDQLHTPDISLPLQQLKASYESRLPKFSLIFAGVGEDGHIASLFPGSSALVSSEDTAVIEDSPKPPAKRITLTHQFFRRHRFSASVYLLFFGKAKQEALRTFMSTNDMQLCPAALFKDFDHLSIITDLEV